MEIRHLRSEDLAEVVAIEAYNFSPEEQINQSVLAYYCQHLGQTSLAVEAEDGQLAGYLLALPMDKNRLDDSVFTNPQAYDGDAPHLAIASLSISPDFKSQGLGTLLLAGLKQVAQDRGAQGISLTCHDYLIPYYEAQGFEDWGPSASQLGGQEWLDMYWKCP